MSRPLTISIALGFLLLAALWVIIPSSQSGDPEHEEASVAEIQGVFQTTCATCHGDHGQGKRELSAPSIASLPRWYIEKQVNKFQTGHRGDHPDDLTGQQMRAAVLSLTKMQIDEALDTLETFSVVDHEPTLTADVKRGAYLYREHCMECHRFNGRGEIAFGSSHLAGLQDWYLLTQWDKFKAGTRGYHPDDEGGAKMRKSVHYLEGDEQAKDVILYIASLAKKYPEDKNSKNKTPKTNE